MPADYPSSHNVLKSGHSLESISKILYRDGQPTSWTPAAAPLIDGSQTPAERSIAENFWHPISLLLYSALNPSAKLDASTFTTLSTNLKQLRQHQSNLIAPTPTGKDAADDPTPIHETMLLACYSALEVLRALPRLCEQLKEKVIQPKTPHPLKSAMPKDWIQEITADTQACFDAIGAVANSRITLLQKRGAAAIKAQVRSGATGAALRALLSDDDVEVYAKEYVDAGVEAWRGVVAVRLK